MARPVRIRAPGGFPEKPNDPCTPCCLCGRKGPGTYITVWPDRSELAHLACRDAYDEFLTGLRQEREDP